jgi:hypothetical protein
MAPSVRPAHLHERPPMTAPPVVRIEGGGTARGVPHMCHSNSPMVLTHGDSRTAKTTADLDSSRFHQVPRLAPKQSVALVRVLTLKRQDRRRAARLCSNCADIRWPPPTSASSAPAHATAIDQAAISSHRGAMTSTTNTIGVECDEQAAVTLAHTPSEPAPCLAKI